MTAPDRFAWQGKAGQVRVGHFLQGARRTLDDIWEVLEMKNPAQIQWGKTLWWRAGNTVTGAVVAIPPKNITSPVTFMLTADEHARAETTKLPPSLPNQWPADAEEVLLLVEKLGAKHIATHDRETGEVVCPSYWEGFGELPGVTPVDEIEHLRIAHGLDVSGLEAIQDHDERLRAIIKSHGDLHGSAGTLAVHRGFPHRHVPEDHSFI